MILSGKEICRRVLHGNIIIDPFDETRAGPNSYDLTLGPTLCQYEALILDAKKEQRLSEATIPEEGLTLYPNTLYLGHTNEIAGVCYAAGSEDGYVPAVSFIEGCSSTGRLGISIHKTAGFGDYGFVGTWTLEITVVMPVRVYANMPICQVYFMDMIGDDDLVYEGHYQNQKRPVASRMWAKIKERENE